jgi:hypothetical protein
MWKFSNDAGCDFEFVIQEGTGSHHAGYGAIHVMWLKVQPEKQGSFWDLRAFFEQVATLLLEHIGYESVWGKAIWSSNSKIKALSQPDPEKDWRALPVFCGFDASLKPMIYEGLVVMYLRMGFVLQGSKDDDNLMVYPSQREIQRVVELIGQEAWSEMTQLAYSRRHHWRKIQSERKAKMENPQQVKRQAIQDAHDKLYRDKRYYEKLCNRLLTQRFDSDLKRFPF